MRIEESSVSYPGVENVNIDAGLELPRDIKKS